MKTTIHIITTRDRNPAPFTPKFEAVRDSGSVDLVFLGAAGYHATEPHQQYWLQIPCYPSTSAIRHGGDTYMRDWAEHAQRVADCIAAARDALASGDYLIAGIGPFPLHASNTPEIAAAIRQFFNP